MRESDNTSWSLFLSVVGAYVVWISSLNDKHSCQLFRIAASFSSLVLLSCSVSTANLRCLPATTFSILLGFSSTHCVTLLQSFESGQGCFSCFSIFSFLRLILRLSFLCFSVSEALFALSLSFLRWITCVSQVGFNSPKTWLWVCTCLIQLIPPTQLIWHMTDLLTDRHIYIMLNLDWALQCGALFALPITRKMVPNTGRARNREVCGQNNNNRSINLLKVITFFTDYKYTT